MGMDKIMKIVCGFFFFVRLYYLFEVHMSTPNLHCVDLRKVPMMKTALYTVNNNKKKKKKTKSETVIIISFFFL